MTRSKSRRGIDWVRALISAEVIRENYLEELLNKDESTAHGTQGKEK